MATEDRRTTRRLLALAGLAMAIAAVVLFVGDPLAEDESRTRGPVPEAGSKFREEAEARRDVSVLEALRPVLGAERAEVRRGLPLPRAAAKVLAIGFDGTELRRAMRARVRDFDWGAVLVTNRNYVSPSQLRGLTRRVARAARDGRHAPPLVAANPALIGNLGPRPQLDIGAGGSPGDARAEARSAGRRLRDAGVGLVLAPNADLGIGGGPAEERAFGDDPQTVARYVREAVAGWNDVRMANAPGRFPGEGGASQDPLAGAATVGLSLEELVARDLRPFAGAVATAPAMQMSAAVYAAWDGVTPATLLPDAVRLLRGRLGFEGVVISAELVAATAATGGGVGEAAVEALRAGCDLLLVAGGETEQDAAYRAIVAAVRSGALPRARLDEAARRVQALTTAARERR